MNVDEAISEVNTNIRPNPDKFSPLYYEVAIAHVTVYKCIGYGEHALYEVTESIACVSDEVESIIEQFYR